MKQVFIVLAFAAVGALAWCLFWLFRQQKILHKEQEENRHLRNLLQMGSHLAQTDVAQLQKLRHDLRHYLLLADDARLSATSSLKEALDAAPAVPSRHSWAISALEQHYREQAHALGFQADLQITPPCDWEEAIPDLCLVLSNLLENSLEALQREGGGWVRARSVSTAGYFSLVVGNTCSRPPRFLNGRCLSSKVPGRLGIGLATVQEVAERYQGQAEFAARDGEFRASVFLLRSTPSSQRDPAASGVPASSEPAVTANR